MNVLFIGGTGQISLPCVHEAVAAGHRVTVLNRGQTPAALPPGVEIIAGELGGKNYAELGLRNFDVVSQFIAFTPEQVAADLEVFAGRVGQYIFISSASVYQKPPRNYLITEQVPTINPFWDYSQKKIAAEAVLKIQSAVPFTIVRPSSTLRTRLPNVLGLGDNVGHRMRAGRPVILAGDGTAPWTITRSSDFAVPFVRLFGKTAALSEDFHITADIGHSWNDIYAAIGAELGVEPCIVRVPTDTLVRYHRPWEGQLSGDKTWAALFDNSKVKRVVGPFACAIALPEILAEPIARFKQRWDASGFQTHELDGLMDRIVAEQSALGG